ncbi:MAG: PD-(D/E)XK nuclease family protein [Candidatus Nanopelagicales bacterium]
MAEAQVLDGMPRRLFAATPTRLTTWVDCPRRYRFTYLDPRPKGAPWAHSSMGAAAHNALRDWWNEPLAERTPDTAVALVRRRWLTDGFRDEAQSGQWREVMAAAAGKYVEGLDPREEPVGVERTVAATTSRLALSGRVDRIDDRVGGDGGRELVIVDYKTGRRTSTVEDARSSLALAVYVAGARRTLHQRSRRVELHHVPTNTVVVFEHTEASLARQLARADEIGDEASDAQALWHESLRSKAEDAKAGDLDAVDAIDAVFAPRPSAACSWCDFRSSCPDGRDSSQSLVPWAALGESAGRAPAQGLPPAGQLGAK